MRLRIKRIPRDGPASTAVATTPPPPSTPPLPPSPPHLHCRRHHLYRRRHHLYRPRHHLYRPRHHTSTAVINGIWEPNFRRNRRGPTRLRIQRIPRDGPHCFT